MASAVSLDYQMFWNQPRKTRASSTKCRPSIPKAFKRSTVKPICVLDCDSTSEDNDTGADHASDNAQSGSVVRFPDVPLRQELVTDGMARQPVATVVSGLEETGSLEVLASPQASPSSWSSSASFASRPTPFTTHDADMPLDYGNDELYPIDPALLGPSADCATSCYPHIDLDDGPDALNTVVLEELLPSRDTPAVSLSGYASDSAFTASNLPKRAVRSVSCPAGFQEALEDTANPDKILCNRVSPSDKEDLHDDNNIRIVTADARRILSVYDQNFQIMDDAGEEPPLKRRRAERFSKGHEEHVEKRRSRCSAIGSNVRVKSPTPALNILNSPAAGAFNDNFHNDAGAADFEEWPLHNVLLKRITLNGVATFQLQFDWNLCATHSQLGRAVPKKPNKLDTSDRPRQATDHSATKSKFTLDEDNLIVLLKEEQQLPWTEIHQVHQRYGNQFPTRSKESLQVDKLKGPNDTTMLLGETKAGLSDKSS